MKRNWFRWLELLLVLCCGVTLLADGLPATKKKDKDGKAGDVKEQDAPETRDFFGIALPLKRPKIDEDTLERFRNSKSKTIQELLAAVSKVDTAITKLEQERKTNEDNGGRNAAKVAQAEKKVESAKKALAMRVKKIIQPKLKDIEKLKKQIKPLEQKLEQAEKRNDEKAQEKLAQQLQALQFDETGLKENLNQIFYFLFFPDDEPQAEAAAPAAKGDDNDAQKPQKGKKGGKNKEKKGKKNRNKDI